MYVATMSEMELEQVEGGPAPAVIIAWGIKKAIVTLAASKAVQAGAGAGIAGAAIIAADNLTSK